MNKTVLNYRVLIEKEKNDNSVVYISYVPTLGISDFGKTVEETVKNTQKAIKIYIEALSKLGMDIPNPDSDEYYVVNQKIEFKHPIAFA